MFLRSELLFDVLEDILSHNTLVSTKITLLDDEPAWHLRRYLQSYVIQVTYSEVEISQWLE